VRVAVKFLLKDDVQDTSEARKRIFLEQKGTLIDICQCLCSFTPPLLSATL
jgi:hypothetical protein